MATFFVFKIRSSCTECGEGIVLEGPTAEATCDACHSTLAVTTENWKAMLAIRFEVERFGLTEGKTRGSSLSDGERRFLLSWGPQRPFCTACGALLDLTNAPPGTDGDLPCACGAMTSTFPPPPWLSKADPAVLQVFGAPRQSSASVAQAATNASRPIGFVCSDCGASLKVNSESARILRCSFCQSDSFIPDPLWRALHPVKKRTPYVLAFR